MNTNNRASLFSGSSQRNVSQNNNGNSNNGAHVEQARNLLEEQNDERIDLLSSQISSLKQITLDIQGEVVSQNRYLDGMGEDFDRTGGLLGGTLSKISTMMNQGGSHHMCLLIVFVVFIFLFLYYIIRGY